MLVFLITLVLFTVHINAYQPLPPGTCNPPSGDYSPGMACFKNEDASHSVTYSLHVHNTNVQFSFTSCTVNPAYNCTYLLNPISPDTTIFYVFVRTKSLATQINSPNAIPQINITSSSNEVCTFNLDQSVCPFNNDGLLCKDTSDCIGQTGSHHSDVAYDQLGLGSLFNNDCSATGTPLIPDIDVQCTPTTPPIAGGFSRCELQRLPTFLFKSQSTQCAGPSSTSPCNTAQYCTGTSSICENRVEPALAGTSCFNPTPPSEVTCDNGPSCSGTSLLCPTSGSFPKPSGTICRPAVGVCDVAEECNGVTTTCPPDGFLPSTTLCSPPLPTNCLDAGYCDGTNSFCVHTAAPAGTICRPAISICDVDEKCTDTPSICPPDTFQPPGTVCNLAIEICELNATCSGISSICPTKPLKPSGTVCNIASGGCEFNAMCSGSTPFCPAKSLKTNSTVCRPSAGDCDVPETCTGTGPNCPTDLVEPSGLVCRTAVNICDDEEVCNGTSPHCPPDHIRTDGYGFKCGQDVYFCGVKAINDSGITLKKKVVNFGGCNLGAATYFHLLPYPGCLTSCLDRGICPNGKMLSSYHNAECVNGTWVADKTSCTNSGYNLVLTTYPLCPASASQPGTRTTTVNNLISSNPNSLIQGPIDDTSNGLMVGTVVLFVGMAIIAHFI